MRVLAVLLVLAGCHSGGGTGVPIDSGSGSGTDSGGPGGSPGMYVAWQANPPLPGEVTSDIAVSEVTFEIKNLQILGDAGAPYTGAHFVTWGAAQPDRESFPTAPAGVYSKVSVELGGTLSTTTVEIKGTVHLSGGGGGGGGPGPHVITNGPGPGGGGGGGSDDNQAFIITETKPFMLSISCDEELEADAPKSFGIRVNLSDTLSKINFANLAKDASGTLVLDEANTLEYPGFHSRLLQAFSINDD